MKKGQLSTGKLFSKKVVKANEVSLDNFKKYKKTIETIEKIRFPFWGQVIYKQVGSSTIDLTINQYDGTATS